MEPRQRPTPLDHLLAAALGDPEYRPALPDAATSTPRAQPDADYSSAAITPGPGSAASATPAMTLPPPTCHGCQPAAQPAWQPVYWNYDPKKPRKVSKGVPAPLRQRRKRASKPAPEAKAVKPAAGPRVAGKPAVSGAEASVKPEPVDELHAGAKLEALNTSPAALRAQLARLEEDNAALRAANRALSAQNARLGRTGAALAAERNGLRDARDGLLLEAHGAAQHIARLQHGLGLAERCIWHAHRGRAMWDPHRGCWVQLPQEWVCVGGMFVAPRDVLEGVLAEESM